MNENALTTVCRAIADPAMAAKFRAVLPPKVSIDRFTRVTIAAIQQNPSVLEADRQSLYNACVHAAARGLMPDGREGVLTVFNTKSGNDWIKKVQFLPMVEGVIKEMAQAGVKAYAVSVHANDEIEVWNDEAGQHVRHKPVMIGDRGERVGALAVATDADGRTYVEFMTREELARAAAKSRSKDRDGNPTGPWRDSPERMEQKTVLHRLRRRVPMIGYDEIAERLHEDEQLEYGTDAPPQEAADTQESAPEAAPASKPNGNGKRPRGLQAVVDQQSASDEAQSDGVELF